MKSSDKYLLSFCVATYEQPLAINQLLTTFSKEFDSRIEIIIRDDSVTDETEKVIEKYLPLFPIKYIRGEKQGLDKAIIDLTNVANGRFIWWFGDDVLHSGAIGNVLNLITNNPTLSFIWVNSCDIANKEMLTWSDRSGHFFKSKDDVLSLNIGLLGFISATLIRRDLALNTLEKANSFVGSAFVCMYIVLGVISDGNAWYYLGEPTFSSHSKPPGEVRWYDQFQVFGINLFRVVSEFSSKFNGKKIKDALSKNLSLVMRAILVERAMGLTTGFASPSPKIIPLFNCYYSYPIFWVYVPLLLIPRKILKIFYRIYKWLSKKKKT